MKLYLRRHDQAFVAFQKLPEDDQVWHMDDPEAKTQQVEGPETPIEKPLVRTLVLSPYAGDVERNTQYARAAMADSLSKGEAPFLSHLLYPQVLIDLEPKQRALGLACEEAWAGAAHQCVAYTDLGWSTGMHTTYTKWVSAFPGPKGMVEIRTLGLPWSRG